MLLEGKTAVVTGIGPGMGRDISLGLAREGADIILVARSDKNIPSVAEEIEALGRRAFPVYGNIAKPEECEHIAAEAKAASRAARRRGRGRRQGRRRARRATHRRRHPRELGVPRRRAREVRGRGPAALASSDRHQLLRHAGPHPGDAPAAQGGGGLQW